MREIEKNLTSLAISPEERMQITEKQKIHASKCKVNRLLNNLKIEEIFKIFFNFSKCSRRFLIVRIFLICLLLFLKYFR